MGMVSAIAGVRMRRSLSVFVFFVASLVTWTAAARSIGTYSGCKPLGQWKQACLDCVGGGNFWQSGQNVCGLPGQAKKGAEAPDDADAGSDEEPDFTGTTTSSGGGGGAGIFSGLWLAVLGLFGAASLIATKRPNAKEALAKLAPYQGWVGAVSAVWGLWGVLSAILHVGWLSAAPLYWLLSTAAAGLQLGLGLLLGVGLIKTFVKNPNASAKLDATALKLAPHQSTLGIAAIVLGVLLIGVTMFLTF